MAADKLSKRLVTSSSFVRPIQRFANCKNNTKMNYEKYSTALQPKEVMDTVDLYNSDSESMLSCSEPVTEGKHDRKSSKRR